jgi:DNA phosphorothioation-dependent restriction protein DptH
VQLGCESSDGLSMPGARRTIANEISAYRSVHPYLQSLRVNAVNPGSGAFVATALEGTVLPPKPETDESIIDERLRVDLVAHVPEPMPVDLPALRDLQARVYDAQPSGERSHLAPFFAVTLRPIRSLLREVPGGDVHLTLVQDQLVPTIQTVHIGAGGDSSSFYGLFLRFLPTFETADGVARWVHRIHLPLENSRERHPIMGWLSSELIELQRSCLRTSFGSQAEDSPNDQCTAIQVELDADQVVLMDSIHHQSDWVVTLDRFFGAEFFDDPQDVHVSRLARKYLLDYSPEFLEGVGHRLLVTTSHREEVEEILARAMLELGFGLVEDSVGQVLENLKTVSGRLALRMLGDDARAREAVSLGVVIALLRQEGELTDSILVPVDSHPELFGPRSAGRRTDQPGYRCDLLRVRFLRGKLAISFIEVKSRGVPGSSEELLERIVDQIESTEGVVRELFFRTDPVRLDHVLQRSRLATILRFYLHRAARHGPISSDESLTELEHAVDCLESGFPNMRAERLGFVVTLRGQPQRPTRLRDSLIRFVTAHDVESAGFSVVSTGVESSGSEPAASNEAAPAGKSAPDPDRQTDNGIPSIVPQLGADASSRPSGGTRSQPPEASRPPVPASHGRLVVAPEASDATVAVELGLTVASQEPISWQIGVRGSPHLFILGIPGQGKSWTIARILDAFSRADLPALVFDFHGQFADPDGPYARLGNRTILDAAEGLPFSPFEADDSAGVSNWRTNAFSVAEIFEYVCGLGDMQRDVVYTALRDCYDELGFGAGSPERLPTVSELANRLESVEAERRVRNVVSRCRPLLEFGLFAEHSGTDLEELLRGGLVLDVHRLGLDTLQLAAGAFLLRKVYKDMFLWGESSRLRLAIVLDEAHRLARDVTLPKLMKEGRKFGIAVIVASQGLADFHEDVVGNAGSKLVFRTNFPMSKRVAGFLRAQRGVDLAAAIEQLDVGEAYVQTSEMAVCSRIRLHPLA